MLFNLKPDTECELTSFVGRTQKAGKEDVPAASFRLRLASVRNELLDLFSPTMRLTVYAPVEGQEQLPGVELVTPVLRSKDLKHWAPETCLEGWSVIVARGITEESALQMGTVKIDDFRFDFHEGGRFDYEFRVSTADVDEEGAGMLWGRQKRKVFVRIVAPELPAPAIDGTTEAFQADHPDAGDLFAAQHGGTSGGDEGPGDVPREGDDEGAAADVEQSGAAEQAELEAGMRDSLDKAGVKPRRGRAVAH